MGPNDQNPYDAFLKFMQENKHLYKNEEDAYKAFLDAQLEIIQKLMKDDDSLDFDLDLESLKTLSMDLVEEALDLDFEFWEERVEILNKALNIWPENYDAYLLQIHPFSTSVERINFLEKVYESILDSGTINQIESWFNYEDRPLIRFLDYLGAQYMENGLYQHALEVFDNVPNIRESDGSGIRSKVMACYTLMNDFDEGFDYFNSFPGADDDESMVIPMLTLSVLSREMDLAKELLIQLTDLNDDVELLFEGSFWPLEKIIDENDTDYIMPGTFNSLAINLMILFPYLSGSEFLYLSLKDLYLSITKNQSSKMQSIKQDMSDTKIIEFPKNNTPSSNTQSQQNPLYNNIAPTQVKALESNQLTTYEDFTYITKKECLDLPGIGPGTVRRLIENGVEFLEE